jgi:hypothetical protein
MAKMVDGKFKKGFPFAILHFTSSLFFFLLAITGYAQKDSTFVFKVRHPEMNMEVFPKDSILWIGQKNKITLRWQGVHKITNVTLDGGSIDGNDSTWVARVTGGKTALLSVYEDLGDKKMKLCLTKLFYIRQNPDPVISICGILADSVADKKDIIYKDKVMALLGENQLVLPVLSFRMTSKIAGVADTLSSENEQFTIDMKNRIHKLPEGTVLYFDKVVCQMPDGKKKMLAPISIFIAKTNKYNVGYRDFGQ